MVGVCFYSPVDEVIEIFDENRSDQFCVVDSQGGLDAYKSAEHFAILFEHLSVVFGQVLLSKKQV